MVRTTLEMTTTCVRRQGVDDGRRQRLDDGRRQRREVLAYVWAWRGGGGGDDGSAWV
jgi:hypothetical protein